ncbi:MAG: hypothetical protein JWR89_5154 [Tardiphaga sp.]|jgi:hypothetical protein|uniref:DUF2934 domain-containing protein n=1 Tax=Tardiphaga sp. TaxID=1926292 RepID=UPI002617EF0A|nr:DUF2934 domain-containing protein [Tardiphaga sp.]MDB5505252.1 hypothetical protein [Tardiphaga sp.]
MSEVPTIALRAYQLWDAAGRPEGRADEFWFQAEEDFRALLEAKVSADNRESDPSLGDD